MSSIDHEAFEIRNSYELLARHPEIQADRVATHYLSMFHYAKQLRKVLELVEHSGQPMSEDTRKFCAYMLESIQRHHAHDLGLRLAWPLKPEWPLSGLDGIAKRE